MFRDRIGAYGKASGDLVIVCPDAPCPIPVHALHEKGLNASVHWSAARNEERVSSRKSTERFVRPSFYIGFRLFVLLNRRS